MFEKLGISPRLILSAIPSRSSSGLVPQTVKTFAEMRIQMRIRPKLLFFFIVLGRLGVSF